MINKREIRIPIRNRIWERYLAEPEFMLQQEVAAQRDINEVVFEKRYINDKLSETHFYATNMQGKKYSVIDSGTMMKCVTDKEPSLKEHFNFWEAIELVNEKMNVDKNFRAETMQDLAELIHYS